MLERTNIRLDRLLDRVEVTRREISAQLDKDTRSEMGQFLTPQPIAGFMASLFAQRPSQVRLLEAGAGVGSLLSAFTAAVCNWDRRPQKLSVVAYELDPLMATELRRTVSGCGTACSENNVGFHAEVREEDFITASERNLGDLLARREEKFNATILNPPYRKIHSDSPTRRSLRALGIETSNLYTGFLALAVMQLEPDGEMVAITPRSFCNGPYFRPFRELLLSTMSIERVHVFESRSRTFGDDGVLQENIIVHARKRNTRKSVVISTSDGPSALVQERVVKYEQLVHPTDPDKFIHIVQDDAGQLVVEAMQTFTTSLRELELEVSTGRVVDFRARPHLRKDPTGNTVPLIYPGHFVENFVEWPRDNFKKPNALAVATETVDLMLPTGVYVLVKRFTSKEERRRIVAALFDPSRVPGGRVGFENHLNVYHFKNSGLSQPIAMGLAVFLNSTVVDKFFRQFNGHTQVNATDLRSLKYPTPTQLLAIGKGIRNKFPEQADVDARVAALIRGTAPVRRKRKG